MSPHFDRDALLRSRVRDLGLRIEGSRLEPLVRTLYEELGRHGIQLRPLCYLSDEWGCPDRVPIVAIPFYHADERLRALERERSGALETDVEILRTLRHEAGHAFLYAYRLYETPEWTHLFGDFSAPYRERYRVDPFDDGFVRYLPAWYGQKHPDEDFAETFAAWLTPEFDWRKRYAGWRAWEKLEYGGHQYKIDRIGHVAGQRYVLHGTAQLGDRPPVVPPAQPINPAQEMDVTLEEYYRSRTEAQPVTVANYFDEELLAIFDAPGAPADPRPRAHEWMQEHRTEAVRAIAAHTGEWTPLAGTLWSWLERRALSLDLRLRAEESAAALLELTALVTATVTHERWRDATAI